ncbi:MAG: SMC-Scp complex subunit ScpB [Candidatus Hermodarchaeota archaeon]
MFRRFRRKKKEKTEEKVAEAKVDIEEIKTQVELKDISEVNEIREVQTSEDAQSAVLREFSIPETPFEEKFAGIPQVISEETPSEIESPEVAVDILPFARAAMENEVSVHGFISPELLKPFPIESKQERGDTTTVILPKIEYQPISLQERIEGALFSIGRPIHVSELIDNFEEDSPTIKRTLRKLQRRRKRTSPIIVDEISKDRWVLHLNPIYSEFFSPLYPESFMEPDERRILTEICYRQPISLAMVKKMVPTIGPVKVTELCKRLEARGYITGEKRARSIVYVSNPKFAYDFGFDDESRRLKLQMLWRLKRLMGDYETEEEEEEEEDSIEEEPIEEKPVAAIEEEQKEVRLEEEEDSIEEEPIEEKPVAAIEEEQREVKVEEGEEDEIVDKGSEEEIKEKEILKAEINEEMGREIMDGSKKAKETDLGSDIKINNDKEDITGITDEINVQETELLDEEE